MPMSCTANVAAKRAMREDCSSDCANSFGGEPILQFWRDENAPLSQLSLNIGIGPCYWRQPVSKHSAEITSAYQLFASLNYHREILVAHIWAI